MKNIREMCEEVARTQTLDVSLDGAIAYQDAIGHAGQNHLEELANDPQLRDSFYRIHAAAYGIVATLNFYNRYDDRACQLTHKIGELEKMLAEKENYVKACDSIIEEHVKEKRFLEKKNRDLEADLIGTEAALAEQRAENTKLKARLYDIIVEQGR